MRDTRLHLEDALRAGLEPVLDADRTHYLKAVLRARSGQALRLFNASDGEWRARIVRIDRHAALLRVEDLLRPPAPEPGATLLFAPIKRPRLELLIEKAVELGVARLVPVLTERTVVEAGDPARWRDRLALRIQEAVEQCERLSLPELAPPAPLMTAVEAAGEGVLFTDERGGGALLPTLRAHLGAALLVGPEGGFAETERAALRSFAHVHPVGLGPTVLRAETAALMLLACHRASTAAEPAS